MTKHIETEFVVLSSEKRAITKVFDSTLYERLDNKQGDFSGHELIANVL